MDVVKHSNLSSEKYQKLEKAYRRAKVITEKSFNPRNTQQVKSLKVSKEIISRGNSSRGILNKTNMHQLFIFTSKIRTGHSLNGADGSQA